MKNYEEMAHDALDRIHEHYAEKRRKRTIAAKTAAAVCPALIVTAAGICVWKSSITPVPDNRFVIEGAADNTSSSVGVTTEIETVFTAAETASKNESSTSAGVSAAVTTADNETHTSQTAVSSATAPIVQPPTGMTNMWIMFGSSLEYNGETYHDNDMANASAYTQDAYIGKVSDLNGEYLDNCHYAIGSNDSVYTVKGTKDVLFVVKENGKIVIMTTREWSIEKYEPERLDPNYVDPVELPFEENIIF